ncbi:MAG: molybdenum ABC transporter permease subunit [Deltaproteobacteria bacterium RBG_16_71_12]|nr:MAG: molybdenum ABC transporter permease subunit [Deltaproteobacteria bacterium RBG_16_71_12]
MARRAQRGVLPVVGALLLAFLVVPVVALVVTATPDDLRHGLAHPLVWPALRLSALTTTASLVIVVAFGTPLAWTLARSSGRAARLAETALELPVVMPPAVAGVALLLAFGRRGLLSEVLDPLGLSPSFTTAAVVMAEVFVSAPFFVQAAIAAFRRVDEALIVVARTFGASPLRVFFWVALPLAAPGLLAGAALSWARALGEFGATLMFAGNFEGRTQTLPLAIYTALEADLRVAQALALVLVAAAFLLLLVVRAVLARTLRPAEAAP